MEDIHFEYRPYFIVLFILKEDGCEILQRITGNILLIQYEKYWKIDIKKQHDRMEASRFSDIRSFLTFCEHSNSSWSVSEPAKQVS